MRIHYLSGRFCQFCFIRINCFCNLDRRSKVTSNLGSYERHFNLKVGNAYFPIGAPTQKYYRHVFSLKNTWTVTFQFLPRINKVICMCNAEASTKLKSLETFLNRKNWNVPHVKPERNIDVYEMNMNWSPDAWRSRQSTLEWSFDKISGWGT